MVAQGLVDLAVRLVVPVWHHQSVRLAVLVQTAWARALVLALAQVLVRARRWGRQEIMRMLQVASRATGKVVPGA